MVSVIVIVDGPAALGDALIFTQNLLNFTERILQKSTTLGTSRNYVNSFEGGSKSSNYQKAEKEVPKTKEPIT